MILSPDPRASLAAGIDRRAAQLQHDTTAALKRLRASTSASFYRFRLAQGLGGVREASHGTR